MLKGRMSRRRLSRSEANLTLVSSVPHSHSHPFEALPDAIATVITTFEAKDELCDLVWSNWLYISLPTMPQR